MEIPKPTAIFTPFGGRVEIRMYGFKTRNWDLKCLDIKDTACQRFLHDLAGISAPDVRYICAPRPTVFNASVVDQKWFMNVEIGFSGEHWAKLYWGGPAEGVKVHADTAAFFSPADCATVVVYNPTNGDTVAAHAGRDSLFDRTHVETGKLGRPHISVIDAVMEKFKNEEKMHCRAFICGAIGNVEYDLKHQHYGEYNKKLSRFLQKTHKESRIADGKLSFSLTGVIEEQLIGHGVLPNNIGTDCTDTENDLDSDAGPVWWSHTRYHKTICNVNDGRNGVLVFRRW